MKLRPELKYAYLLLTCLLVGGFLLLAPVYPRENRVMDVSIVLPSFLVNCGNATFGANGWFGGGWASVDAQVKYPASSPLHIKIYDPFGPTFLNQTGTRLQAVFPVGRLPEGYKVLVENPCDGSTIGIEGTIEFWHQETRWTSLFS